MDRSFTIIFTTIFGAVGLVFLAVAFFSLRSEVEFRKGAVSATGTAVGLEPSSSTSATYKPVFEFVDQNDRLHRVVGSVASNPPAFHRGDEVRVLYRPENPEGARLDSFMESWFLPLIFGGLGTVFTGIASGVALYALRGRRVRAWLASNAVRVQARVDAVERYTAVRKNGLSPWRIVAQWQHPVSQKVYVFRSAALWFDPAPYMRDQTVWVRVNMDNPRQYEMDVDFLPKLG